MILKFLIKTKFEFYYKAGEEMRCRRNLQIIKGMEIDSINKKTMCNVAKNLKHRFKNLTSERMKEIHIKSGIIDGDFHWVNQRECVIVLSPGAVKWVSEKGTEIF